MARIATIIDTVTDHWGDLWDVREKRATRHGFLVMMGWPAGQPRGRAGSGGPRVIVTPELAAHFEACRLRSADLGLPIGNTAIKRIRAMLGHHHQIDRAAWWEERADDLTDLTLAHFALKHGCSMGAASLARSALLGPTLRPAGWWRAPDVARIIQSAQPRADIAQALSISVGSLGRLRFVLKNAAAASLRTDQDAGGNSSPADDRASGGLPSAKPVEERQRTVIAPATGPTAAVSRRTYRHLGPDELETATAMLNDGARRRQVADALGVEVSAIAYRQKKGHLPPMQPSVKKTTKTDIAVGLYLDGQSVLAIATHLGVTRQRIEAMLSKRRVARRPRGVGAKTGKA